MNWVTRKSIRLTPRFGGAPGDLAGIPAGRERRPRDGCEGGVHIYDALYAALREREKRRDG